MIRFNTKLNPPQFQGYTGDGKWIGFNAQKGDKGDKGEDFGNLIKLVNGGKQEIFGNNSGCKVTNFGLKYIDNTFKRLFTKKYAMFDEFKLDNNRLNK